MFLVSKRTKKLEKKSTRARKSASPEAGQGGGGRPCSQLTLLSHWHPMDPCATLISSRNEKINTIEDHSSISLDRSTGVFIKAILMLMDTQLQMG